MDEEVYKSLVRKLIESGVSVLVPTDGWSDEKAMVARGEANDIYLTKEEWYLLYDIMHVPGT